jgi:uncharacterized protein (AIM24 family)
VPPVGSFVFPKGAGICVFESPVPADEVLRIDLKDESLQVDGSFALMRTGRIEFSVEKSTRSLVGTLTSGEGLLQTFRGTGSVWLAPTQAIYHRLQAGGMAALGVAPRSSDRATGETARGRSKAHWPRPKRLKIAEDR